MNSDRIKVGSRTKYMTAITTLTFAITTLTSSPAHANSHSSSNWTHVHQYLTRHEAQFWDGRSSKHCAELFNPRQHDIRFRHGLVAPNFYVLVCDGGQFRVHDGHPFKHLTERNM